MTLKEKLKIAKAVLQTAGAFCLPMTEKEKQAYLARAEDKVKLYQPKIEEKTGVELGKVYVLPYMLDIYQKIYQSYNFVCNELRTERKKDISKIEEFFRDAIDFTAIASLMAYKGTSKIIGGYFRQQHTAMAAREDCLLVPFGFVTKIGLDLERNNIANYFDTTIVHELSHILWNKIENQGSNRRLVDYREIGEGFATYCETTYFAELYPKGQDNQIATLPKLYMDGKKKIEQLVANYGEKILLEIPNRWPELMRGLNKI